MDKELKDLLLKDLCARLPYHPILNWKFLDNTSKDDVLTDLSDLNIWWITKARDCEVKPYLRPMSSMTEEEKEEYCNLQDKFLCSSQYLVTDAYELFDWLNFHHFDYRGLIEKGLAIEALKGMY